MSCKALLTGRAGFLGHLQQRNLTLNIDEVDEDIDGLFYIRSFMVFIDFFFFREFSSFFILFISCLFSLQGIPPKQAPCPPEPGLFLPLQ